jgi:integrase
VPKAKKVTDAIAQCIEHNAKHWAPKTQELHKNSQQHLETFFGKLLLSQVSPDHISTYQSKRKSDGVSNRSINIEIGLLRLTFKRAKMWAVLADDVRMLRENKDVGRALSPDEESRLLAACKASSSRSLFPAVLVSLHSGLRNQELRLLRWRQVDLLAATIQVGKSKTEGGSGRVVPLSQTALAVLQGWASQFPALKPAHYVFPSERYHLKGTKGVYGGKTEVFETLPEEPVRSFATAWRTAKATAGVECRWHDMRHTALSRNG